MSINFSPFEIGRSALLANQLGISITGQNIANVNTPGYSRRRVALAETAQTTFTGVAPGSGVTILGVREYRDRFIEGRIQAEGGIAGRLNAKKDALSQVESVLQGSEGAGLQNAINSFFGSFRDLDANPNSISLRSVAVQKGAALASSFQATRNGLNNIILSTNGQVLSAAEEVNSLTERIAELNIEIRNTKSLESAATALHDQRSELINRVSELTGAHSINNEDGTISLYIGEGRNIVTGDKAIPLTAFSNPPSGLYSFTLDGQPATFEEGSIKGFQEALAEASNQTATLDGLAEQIVQRVNTLHTSGTDLSGNPGANFFSTGAPVTAANISVDPAISANPRLVVASALAQPGQNGTIAGEIANLLTDPNTTAGTRTGSFTSIYGSLISDAGEQIREAEDGLQTQAAIISQLSQQRESVSGVSLDEEAVNLLQYQRAYEAAARFLRVADEMTQTIISLAG